MAKAARSEHAELADKTDAELRDAIRQNTEALRNRITERLEEYRAMAREVGLEVSIGKTGGGEAGRKGRRSAEAGEDRRAEVAAKYANPDNPREMWSGRGKKPKWVSDKLAAGRDLSDLLIERSSSQSGEEAA